MVTEEKIAAFLERMKQRSLREAEAKRKSEEEKLRRFQAEQERLRREG